MILAEIISDEIIGPVRVSQGIKLTSATNCLLLKNVLDRKLEELSLSRSKKVVFMHDNAPCHVSLIISDGV